MNLYLGGFGGWDGHEFLDTANYKFYFKQSDLADPGPSTVFVFLDMRPDSIDIGNFAPRMTGWPDQPEPVWVLRSARLLPPSGVRFLLRGRPLRDAPLARRTAPCRPWWTRAISRISLPRPNNPDVAWLQDHATRPKN